MGRTVGIIGLGLIGGSMAIDLRRRGFASRILGVEREPVNASAAAKIGLVDEVVDYGDCIAQADILVVAVPVGAAVRMVCDILDRFQSSRITEANLDTVSSALSAYVRETKGVQDVQNVICILSGRQIHWSCTVLTEEGTSNVVFSAVY